MVQNQVTFALQWFFLQEICRSGELTIDEPVVREEFDAVVLDENYSVSGGNHEV